MIEKPVITGEWRHIFDPNIKHKDHAGDWYTNDHTFTQSKDGRWHAYGIIGWRPAGPWEKEKQFFHASADSLTGKWIEHEYAMVADGKLECLLWAPHIFKENGTMYMFYNAGNMQKHARHYASWGTLHLATSAEDDGYTWKRHDRNPLFSDPGHARDSYILKHNGMYYFYYTRTLTEVDLQSAVAVRTSPDLKHWSGPKIVNLQAKGGNWGGNCESPFVVKRNETFYLFICLAMEGYEKTHVYWSKDPENFPEENLITTLDTHAAEIIRDGNNWFISNTGWKKKGLFIAPLTWTEMLRD